MKKTIRRFIENRSQQFDYKSAVDADLPIIGLRAMISNGHWENY